MNSGIAARCAIVAMACASAARAYEPSTHVLLSEAAYTRSKLNTDATVLTDLGLSAAGPFTEIDPSGNVQGTRSAMQIVGQGAFHEDHFPGCSSSPTWARMLNHFFDPQHGGRPLTVLGASIGVSSPDWALEDRGEVTTVGVVGCSASGLQQAHSYRNAQGNIYEALVGQTETYRNQRASLAMQSLGHMVHHIQDMAQPQHSRNGVHKFPYQAYYEYYTEQQNGRINGIVAAGASYPIPVFATARQYWTSGVTPAYSGMADFTAYNYVTYNNNFGYAPGAGVLPAVGFPYPNGTNANGTQKRIETRSYTIQYGDNSNESGQTTVVLGQVFDGYTGTHSTERVLAATSLLHAPLIGRGLDGQFTTNEVVFEDNYSILLPRAVAFSAGIINHFFAGKLDVARSGSGWAIRNLSTESMNGTFVLHYEDNARIRYQVAPAAGLVSTWTGTLAAGQSTPVLAEPPTTAAKVIAAFKGTIGTETSLQRAAGKVVSYTPPPTACGGTLKRGGGFEGLDTTMEMGSTSGSVQLSFEAFSVKDSLVVTAVNSANTQLYTTNGMVSGLHTKTFTFNPTSLGTTRARVRIVGSESGTAWNIAMSCPGRNLSSEDFPPQRTVTFRFGSTLTGARGSCQADFYVDGVRAGLAFVSATVGPSSITRTLTQGVGHGAEFRNYSCTSDALNILVGADVTDSAGTVRLQNMNQSGIRLFDVH